MSSVPLQDQHDAKILPFVTMGLLAASVLQPECPLLHWKELPNINSFTCQSLHQLCSVVMAVVPQQLDVRVP